ncbi:hypothetical protein [Brevibacillus reuszeri]|uniref:hypothetical protein n=1 Tax=Brevibacillus reuszeri TaxID=54915 RepID=UPI003D2071C5
MNTVIDRLIDADQILVVGFRNTYAAAYWFSSSLGMLRETVSLFHQTEEFYEKLCNLTREIRNFYPVFSAVCQGCIADSRI